MPRRLLEIEGTGLFVHARRGFIVAERVTEEGRQEERRFPIDDVESIIVSGWGNSFSQALLARLAERNVPLVVLGAAQTPVGVLVPTVGMETQAARIEHQITVSKPVKKQIWSALVKRKIEQQSAVLESLRSSEQLKDCEKKVRSGDPSNVEAQAARKYWLALFGDSFRRDRNAGAINAALNYGYMIIRSSVLRSIFGAGLHPAFSVHHRSAENPLRLADDLMEPFRPYVDAQVAIHPPAEEGLAKNDKRILAEVLRHDINSEPRRTVGTAIRSLVDSYVTAICTSDPDSLELPLVGLTLNQLNARQ